MRDWKLKDLQMIALAVSFLTIETDLKSVVSVSFLASKNFRKGLCKVLIFNKKLRGCSREIDLMKKGLRLFCDSLNKLAKCLEKLT